MYFKGFLSESLLTILWVMWVYIVCVKKWGNAHFKTSRQRVSRVTCGLAKSRNNLRNTVWQKTVHIPSCTSCVAFRRFSIHEPVASKLWTSLSSQVFTKLSHSILILNPTNIQGNDWINIIKFDTELKPTKHSWKSQLNTHPHTHK